MKKPNIKQTIEVTDACFDMMSPGAVIGIFILGYQVLIAYPIWYLIKLFKNCFIGY